VQWLIGSDAVELAVESRDSGVRLVGFKNKTGSAVHDYISPEMALASVAAIPGGDASWMAQGVVAEKVLEGGRPAVRLTVTLASAGQPLKAVVRITAFPHAALLTHSVELWNAGAAGLTLSSVSPFRVGLSAGDASAFKRMTLVGANCSPDQGTMPEKEAAPTFHDVQKDNGTRNQVPWLSFQRCEGERDGWFLLLDQEGPWEVAADRKDGGSPRVTVSSYGVGLKPNERYVLPLVTLGVYHGELDDMGQRVYGWFYEYRWDHTHHDWFARALHLDRFNPYWSEAVWNVQEKFASRMAMVFNTALAAQRIGEETLWDDISWWASPATIPTCYEGPDFGRTSRFLEKADMKFIGYFSGSPRLSVLKNKAGAEGAFQWRTDMCDWGRGNPGGVMPEQVRRFLAEHPRCSFHACSGGGGYDHGFEVQRLGDVNQMSDHSPEQSNYCFSYLEIPDKFQNTFGAGEGAQGVFDPAVHRRILSHVPSWYAVPSPESQEAVRQTVEIYHYLIGKGVAGRWSYMFHPAVKGDQPLFYVQRTSYDRERACVILKHVATNGVTVFPRGLLSGHSYVVGFASKKETATRTGKELMENGIVLAGQTPSELIYLGLPDHPKAGDDAKAPLPPSRVLARRETNVGVTGVSLYWSPGSDDRWISYYEVKRGDTVLGKASARTYYFDCSQGCDPQAVYGVRTVDGDGNASEWKRAERLSDEPMEADALGGLFPEQGHNGWSAEVSADGVTFRPMKWIAGSNAGQPGSLEGYWEGADTARVGRGWQQASAAAQCVRAWQAPRAGTVRVVGRAIKEFRHRFGAALKVRILRNDKPLWPAEGWATVPEYDLAGCTHDVRVTLEQGDTLRFVLDKGASPKDELLAWMPRIVYEENTPASAPLSTVRIACGAKKPYTDALGNVWEADACFSGGLAVKSKGLVLGAEPAESDGALYLGGREGKEFFYSIPVAPGLYSLRLKFAELKYAYFFQRPFNLEINGRRVLSNFDVCQAAGGSGTAYEKVFRYLVPDGEGRLVLRFTGGWEPNQKSHEALVQAIEVLPEIKPAVRIRCGSSEDYVDWNGCVWGKDAGFEGGNALACPAPVKPNALPDEKLKASGNEPWSPGVGEADGDPEFILYAAPTLYDQALYRTARSGRSFRYAVPVPPGLYAVHLKFAEMWLKESGQRPMNIAINGRCLWKNWDPAAAADRIRAAADVRAEDVVPNSDGKIVVELTATGSNDAVLQAIEIE